MVILLSHRFIADWLFAMFEATGVLKWLKRSASSMSREWALILVYSFTENPHRPFTSAGLPGHYLTSDTVSRSRLFEATGVSSELWL